MPHNQRPLFPAGDDLPLFSGTPQSVVLENFQPKEEAKQERLPGMPALDWQELSKRRGQKEG